MPSLRPAHPSLQCIQAAAEGDNLGELQRAVERARALQLSEETLQPSLTRLATLREEEMRSHQRKAEAVAAETQRSEAQRMRMARLGVEETRVPSEFLCPITQEKMWDPVVASDGHSYEREAISHVLFKSNGLSPLTRSRLRPVLFANIALRKRIEEYEAEMCTRMEEVAEVVERRVHSLLGSECGEQAGATRRMHEGGRMCEEAHPNVLAYEAEETQRRAPRTCPQEGCGISSLPDMCNQPSERSGRGLEGEASGEVRVSRETEEIRAILSRLKLDRYAAALTEHGYDDWGEILSMSRVKLCKLVRRAGMLDNHADRFRAYVEEQAAALTTRGFKQDGVKGVIHSSEKEGGGGASEKRAHGGSVLSAGAEKRRRL